MCNVLGEFVTADLSYIFQIRCMIVGLGAGLLPMFVHNHLPFDDIQVTILCIIISIHHYMPGVSSIHIYKWDLTKTWESLQIVELDPVVGDVAKKHFGFIEDERMKVGCPV